MNKVSIIIINYNDKLRVTRAIESALRQTHKNKEIIMVDDGSDKETRDIYKKYSEVKLIQLERDDKSARTPSRARNAGIKHSTGDYICVLDSDNYFNDSFVEDLLKVDGDVAFCNWEIVGKQQYKANIEKVWNMQGSLLENYLFKTHLDHQCLLIKKSYLDKCGHYDERLPRSQDCDLIVRLMMQNGEWKHVPKTLFVFEKHEDDQMKSIASIHGKALWSLKNNINISWMAQMCQNEYNMLSIMRAIEDFTTSDKWKTDYENSEFKRLNEDHQDKLFNEVREKVAI